MRKSVAYRKETEEVLHNNEEKVKADSLMKLRSIFNSFPF